MSESTPLNEQPSSPPRRHRLRKTLIISGSIVGGLIVLGTVLSVVLPPAPTNTAASGPTGTTSPASATSRTPSATRPAATTVRASTRPPATTTHRAVSAPPVDNLTGFGATRDTWDRTHVEDHYFDGGAYDPDPSLPQTDGRVTDKYVGVNGIAGYIGNYTVNLSSTSLTGAESVIAGEFPPDAHILWTQHISGCVQVEYASAAVHAALGSTDVGDALVEYSDVVAGAAPPASPTTFNDALVSDTSGAQPDPTSNC